MHSKLSKLFNLFLFILQLSLILFGVVGAYYWLIVSGALGVLGCFFSFGLMRKKIALAAQSDFRHMASQFPGHLYLKDLKGACLWSNENNWKDLGLSFLDEYIGKTDYQLYPKEEADQLREADREVVSKNKAMIFEEVMSLNNGRRLYLSIKAPVKNHKNEVVGIIGTSVDITDAKKETASQLKMLEDIIAIMPGHVYWMNREGIYLGCNDNEARAVGLSSRKEIIGKRNVDIPGFVIPDLIDAANNKVMDSGQPLTLEEPARLSDGTYATFRSSKVPLKDETGKVVGLVGISIDITAEKEAARLKKEKEIAEEKERHAKLFASSIAHELRTPLTAIGFSQTVLKKLIAKVAVAHQQIREDKIPLSLLSDREMQHLSEVPGEMQDTLHAANTFINMMLMKVNLNNAKPQKLVSVSASQMVDEALSHYPFSVGDRALVNCAFEEDFTIHVDKALFEHVIFNLLKNALHYVKEANKGEIFIYSKSNDGKYNVLYFKDTGMGMSEEVRAQAFDGFYSRTRHGTGIGLALCKAVMKEFGGKITCESTEGEYTLFSLYFPCG